MNPSDIKFFHSGGTVNNDPDFDLGGLVSIFPLATPSLNNLFDALTRKQTQNNDYVDYRCFYIFNKHSTDTLFDAKLYIESERKSGSFIDIGVPIMNEKQQLIFVGTPWEGDNITLDVDDNMVVIDYYLNVTQWQGEIQTKLRGLPHLQDVIVEQVGSPANVSFTVNFIGSACCRAFPVIGEIANGLHNTTLNVLQVQVGTPIGSTAGTISTRLHRPTGILFSYPLVGNPISLGNLRPDEGFPVWVRRTTRQGTLIGIEDNFVLRVEGATV